MHRVQHQNLTNAEIARYIDNTGVKNLDRETLEHVSLRFIEIFREWPNEAASDLDQLPRTVTRVPHVVS